ncbi:MAG: hypothetical protein IKW39_05650 [Alphaproteobacteria bacterium]|nr:hypothetical protein [Alphaproteobacteria bacterium]
MDKMFLTELLVTRLSHDLVGNIGALSNAVELMADEDDDDKEDINKILTLSSSVLSKRLKFFRLCFGLSNAKVNSLEDLNNIICDYISTIGNPNYKIEYSQKISTPKIYKFIMPAVMMMADIVIKTGKISVFETENSLRIEVSSEDKLNLNKLKSIENVLNNEKPEYNISSFAPLYYLLAYTNENEVKVYLDGTSLVIGE